MLTYAPVLLATIFCKPFKPAVDASDVGGVFLQEDENVVDRCYFSRKLNKHQKVYSASKKECLALIFSLQFFEVCFIFFFPSDCPH